MNTFVLTMMLIYFIGTFVYSIAKIMRNESKDGAGVTVASTVLSLLIYGSLTMGVIYLATH
jgi:uncharacterized membrane protein